MKLLNLAIILALICVCGCNNTDYGTDFSRKGFDSVKVGMTLVELEKQIGKPLQIYEYELKGDRLVPTGNGVSMTWETFIKNKKKHLQYKLIYARQINARRNFWHCHVLIADNVVKDKSLQKITE